MINFVNILLFLLPFASQRLRVRGEGGPRAATDGEREQRAVISASPSVAPILIRLQGDICASEAASNYQRDQRQPHLRAAARASR